MEMAGIRRNAATESRNSPKVVFCGEKQIHIAFFEIIENFHTLAVIIVRYEY